MKFFKALFNRDNFFILALVGVLGVIVSNIDMNLQFLNPIEQTFSDFDVTDIYFSQLHKDEKAEERITIVNIGMLGRGEISELMQIVGKHQPKVVGVDAFFHQLKGEPDSLTGKLKATLDDSLLQDAIKMTNTESNKNKVVMVTKASFKKNSAEMKKDNPNYDSLETSDNFFMKYADGGLANLITEGTRDNVLADDEKASGLETSRTFAPKEDINKERSLCFAAKIAEKYAPEKSSKLIQRNKEVEFINFKGNIKKYRLVDHQQLREMAGDTALKAALEDSFKDKIVLFGYMGPTINTKNSSDEDKFFTPMNPIYIGKSSRDMYGIVVHANIISMILDEDYIDEMPKWLNYIVVAVLAFLSISLFSYTYKTADFWFDGISLLTQAVFTLAILFLIIFVFDNFNVRVDWSLGILAVIFAPNVIEIYFGVVKRWYERTLRERRNREKATVSDELL